MHTAHSRCAASLAAIAGVAGSTRRFGALPGSCILDTGAAGAVTYINGVASRIDLRKHNVLNKPLT